MIMESFRGTILLKKPNIIYCGDYSSHDLNSSFFELGKALREQQIIYLMLTAWSHEHGNWNLNTLTDFRRRYLAAFPNHHIIHLANNYVEYDALVEAGIPAFCSNQNCHVDENLFTIRSVEKKYDAVYNGQFLPFKRHKLAKEIKRLAIIGYNHNNSYCEDIRKDLSHATFLNFDGTSKWTWLSQLRVSEIYNQSRVGLCLSAIEGAMHASMEYLLCGLPIVTTFSQGGRDFYFDGRFVHWTCDEEKAIAQAVNSLSQANISSDFIRKTTLEKIATERFKFFEVIATLIRGLRSIEEIKNNYIENFNDKLITPKPITLFVESLTK
jgi:glycosyltransferase involved in cell wall biosynthesis